MAVCSVASVLILSAAVVVGDEGAHATLRSSEGASLRPALSSDNWENLTTRVHGKPPGVAWVASAYDPASNVVVYFGGRNISLITAGGPGPLNQTWVYEANGTWVNVTSPGPPARSLAMMAWDPEDGYMVLFGGFHDGIFFDDTWAWTGGPSGGTWTQLPVVGPSGRFAAVMVTDPAVGGILLTGGCDLTCSVADTWVFSHGQWSELNSDDSPQVHFASGVYDPVDQSVVLFGGCSAGFGCPSLSDFTWVFSNGIWRALALNPSSSPAARAAEILFWDGTSNTVFLFGGFGTSQVPSFGDTWEFNGTNWTPLETSTSPGVASNDTGVWDPAIPAPLVFLGESNNVYPAATWIFLVPPPASPPSSFLSQVTPVDWALIAVIVVLAVALSILLATRSRPRSGTAAPPARPPS